MGCRSAQRVKVVPLSCTAWQMVAGLGHERITPALAVMGALSCHIHDKSTLKIGVHAGLSMQQDGPF